MSAPAPVLSGAAITASVLRGQQELEELGPSWNELFSRAGCENVFLSSDWMEEWWTHYGRGQSLFLVALRNPDGYLLAVAPFCIGPALGRSWGTRSLKFLASKWVCSDHLDILVEPGLETPAAIAIARVLFEHRREWTYIELSDCDETSPTISELRQSLKRLGLRERVMRRGVCPYIPLPPSFDAYLAGLNSNWRRNFRHALRLMQRAGAVRFLALKDTGAIQNRFAEALQLHGLRFKERGVRSTFLDDSIQAFHSAVLARMAPRGWVRLYLLEIDERAVAAYYGFSVRKRFLAMQSGFDPAWSSHSVGLVMVGMAIQEAIRGGDTEVDFLRGDERYKFHWTNQVRGAVTTRIFNRTVRGSLVLAGSCISTMWAAARHAFRRSVETRPTLARVTRCIPVLRQYLAATNGYAPREQR